MWEWIKELFRMSIDKLLLLCGVVLVFFAFDPIRYQNEQWDFRLGSTPNWILLLIGGGILVFFGWKNWPRRLESLSTKKIDHGYMIRFDPNHAVSIVFGNIQDTPGGEHSAVVLPANRAFDDDCIRDDQSALGSFFLKHFPTGISHLQDLIRNAAIQVSGQTMESFTMAPPGTTILLSKPLGSQFVIMVTAVTTTDPEKRITADTLSLVASVREVFKTASQNRISSLTMPVMGTGHGGLDFKAALFLLLVQSMHCMQHEGSHHVRDVTIVVYDPDKQKQGATAAVVQSFGNIARG